MEENKRIDYSDKSLREQIAELEKNLQNYASKMHQDVEKKFKILLELDKKDKSQKKRTKGMYVFFIQISIITISLIVTLLINSNPVMITVSLAIFLCLSALFAKGLYNSRKLSKEEEIQIEEKFSEYMKKSLDKFDNELIESFAETKKKLEATVGRDDENKKKSKIGYFYTDLTIQEAAVLSKRHNIGINFLLNYQLLDSKTKNLKNVTDIQASVEGVALRNKIIRVAKVDFNDQANKDGYKFCYCLDQVAPDLRDPKNLIQFDARDAKYKYEEYLKQNIEAKLNLMIELLSKSEGVTIVFRAKALGAGIFASGNTDKIKSLMLNAYKEALNAFPLTQKIIIDFNDFGDQYKEIFNNINKDNVTILFSNFNIVKNKLNDPIDTAPTTDKKFVFFTENAGNIGMLPGAGGGLNGAWGAQSNITQAFASEKIIDLYEVAKNNKSKTKPSDMLSQVNIEGRNIENLI